MSLFGTLLLAPNAYSAAIVGKTDAQNSVPPATAAAPASQSGLQVQCLPAGGAFLRARLKGSINTELSWTDRNLNCAGSVRPDEHGLRLRFSSAGEAGAPNLVLLFGITGLKEGETGKALPANLTIIREGAGEFYATQGDNKCTIDEITQEPINGIPMRQRAYRITARGFCTQPARELNGEGSILVTRFDFAGRADFVSDDQTDATLL
ncbi:MAG: hypothetical protein QM808_10425 [Steroidobacteraceae bacterium]